jgi:hypothetical protein
MIFGLIKLIVWLAGVTVVAYFVLPYFGYEVNVNYFNESKVACQEKLSQCQKNLIKNGLEGAKEKCDFWCVDPKLIIKKTGK